jgi:hypothetical protein
MRLAPIILVGALLAACGESAPNPYPAEAKPRFEQSCPPESEVCTCTWDKITRAMTYEDYEAALARFRETGSMAPAITHARTVCLEKHKS